MTFLMFCINFSFITLLDSILLWIQVEQLHKIFKLCGSPPDDYWKKAKLPHATLFKPQQTYSSCLQETFKDLPVTSVNLLQSLLSIESYKRGTASSALSSEVGQFSSVNFKLLAITKGDFYFQWLIGSTPRAWKSYCTDFIFIAKHSILLAFSILNLLTLCDIWVFMYPWY